ncbi:peptidylprolyl isomerase [Sphingomonas flavescens]|jgi:peptidylprolyl isomerase|uniref:peptidylprolyl isomerase n=1 Tax=Sphingomonas flavescens TaxID=3132797 RepID=UPI00280627A0|nr:peptidylprolyl isomerase [Sphingomonas limnosediminicola]
MRSILLAATAAILIGAAPPKKLPTPNDIVAAAPPSAWKTIPADDLLVLDLTNGGRIVIQLAPAFAPVHVNNIKLLARGGYWNDATIYRVQDNYVAQWGLNESDKPWPAGVVAKPPAEYTRPLKGLKIKPLGSTDPYAPGAGFADGWPVAYSAKAGWADLTHCYGTVGVGRDLAPDTGTGGELYAIIGHGPRQLDRVIAIVGRVVEGIERFSTLPRGTEALGFYKDKAQYVPISSIRLASEIPANSRPSYEVMDTNSPTFAQYLKIRANRHDDFYTAPAGGVDLCNVGVPIRKKA